jgi:hypothetical protein
MGRIVEILAKIGEILEFVKTKIQLFEKFRRLNPRVKKLKQRP